jgi:hypothetical protein
MSDYGVDILAGCKQGLIGALSLMKKIGFATCLAMVSQLKEAIHLTPMTNKYRGTNGAAPAILPLGGPLLSSRSSALIPPGWGAGPGSTQEEAAS